MDRTQPNGESRGSSTVEPPDEFPLPRDGVSELDDATPYRLPHPAVSADANGVDELAISVWDRWLAPGMSLVALSSLLAFASLLHFGAADDTAVLVAACHSVLALAYPLIWMEIALHLSAGRRIGRGHWFASIFPPARLIARDHVALQFAWIPCVGWRPVGQSTRDECARVVGGPMIVLALGTLPLLAVEHFLHDFIASNRAAQWAVSAASGLIWAGFTAEFCLMFSLADKKWKYVREHWIDLAIILLPILASVRILQLGRWLRLQPVARSLRMMRLKTVAIRLYRALVLLGVLDRMLRTSPETRLARLLDQEAQHLASLDAVRRQIAELRSTMESHEPADDESLRSAA